MDIIDNAYKLSSVYQLRFGYSDSLPINESTIFLIISYFSIFNPDLC